MSSIGYVSHHDEHDMGKSGIAQLTMRSATQLWWETQVNRLNDEILSVVGRFRGMQRLRRERLSPASLYQLGDRSSAFHHNRHRAALQV